MPVLHQTVCILVPIALHYISALDVPTYYPQPIPSVSAPASETSGVSHLRKPMAGRKSPQSSPPRPARVPGPSKGSPLLESYEGKRKALEPGTAKKPKGGTSSGSQTPEPTPVVCVCVCVCVGVGVGTCVCVCVCVQRGSLSDY